MKRLLLVLILLTGCAHTSLFNISDNLPKYPKLSMTDTENDIKIIISYFFDHVGMSKQKNSISFWSIGIQKKPIIFRSQAEDGGIKYIVLEGLTYPPGRLVIIYSYQNCLAASSLIHELFHVVGYTHRDSPEIFKESNNLTKQAIKELCGEDYVIPPFPEIRKEWFEDTLEMPPEGMDI